MNDSQRALVERDEAYQRDYIPMPGGWEIQTKGKGSTFRLADIDGGRRLAIPDSPYLHETLTAMAHEVNAAYADLLSRLAAAELDGARLNWLVRGWATPEPMFTPTFHAVLNAFRKGDLALVRAAIDAALAEIEQGA